MAGKISKKSSENLREETHIEWTITDFFASTLNKNDGEECLRSPDFTFNGVLWFFELYYGTDFLNLYFEAKARRDYSVVYSFGLKKVDGSVEKTFMGIVLGDEEYDEDGWEIIEQSDVLERKSELAPSNVLTILCTLVPVTNLCSYPSVLENPNTVSTFKRKPDLKNLDALSEDFKELFANVDSCDTTLCVKDNEYKVHRTVLMARSTVFAAMFQHDTKEKQTGIVDIPDCEPESFKHFLEYLYCGKLEEASFHTVFHLYSTSDKYNVQKLKTFCVEYLMRCITVENICDIVVLADKYDEMELLAAAQNVFNKNLNQILKTSEWFNLLNDNCRLANKLMIEMSLKVKI